MDRQPDDVATTVIGAAESEPTTDAGGGATKIGSALGRYIVLGEIGQGGMGAVVRAYDPKLMREVAIKEVLRSAHSDATTARLVAEARAMARVSHPNVVSVFDVEELEEGRLALVMEYVPGTNLRDWLRADERPWREVVNHFIAAGRGLQAAHAAGLLHRDFKPANVLIRDDGQVKVGDFGLAKEVSASTSGGFAEDASDARSADLTQTGTVMGTPLYMAPEQYDPRWNERAADNDLAAAADQYAFCVALWEGLHGAPPFVGALIEGKKLAGPPSWAAPEVPPRIAEAVRRGLSARPEDRWPELGDLLRALRPDGGRRRLRFGSLALVGAVGVGAAVTAPLWGASEQRCAGARTQLSGIWDAAQRARLDAALRQIGPEFASTVADKTVADLDAYATAWTSMHEENCRATTVRGEQSAATMDLRMACLQRAKMGLQAAVAVLSQGDPRVLGVAHEVVESLRPVAWCEDIERLQADVEPPPAEEEAAVEAARGHLARAEAEREAGQLAEAKKSLEAAEQGLAGVEYPPVHAELALEEALLLGALAQFDDAVAKLERSLELAGRWRQWDVMGSASRQLVYVVGSQQSRPQDAMRYIPYARSLSRDDRQLAGFHNNYGTLLSVQGRYAEAEAEHRQALELNEAGYGPDHWLVGVSYDNLANVVDEQGRYEEAEAAYREALRIKTKALGPNHPLVASTINNLATLLDNEHRFEEAEVEFRRALAIWEAALGPSHPDVAIPLQNLGGILAETDRLDEALPVLRRALQIYLDALGPEHPDVAMARNNLAAALDAAGKYPEAVAEYRATLAVWEKALGPEHPDVGLVLNNLAGSLRMMDETSDAEAMYRRGLEISEGALGPEHHQSCTIRGGLAGVLEDQKRFAEAEEQRRLVLQHRAASLSDDHPWLADARSSLANILLTRQKFDEALPLAEAAWARIQRGDFSDEDRLFAAYALGRALAETAKDPATIRRARPLLQQALEGMRGHGEDEVVAELEAWLRTHPG